jgi:(1->4)-alpha-D-glucan 1-alpha-D-glucosylmutase
MNHGLTQQVEGESAPDGNAQYLLYQTLVGTWPLEPMDDGQRDAYLERITQYTRKALREAKLRTSWMSPSEPYEQAVADFIRRTLVEHEGAAFRAELDVLAHQISTAGFINALTQLLLKITLPGVPDFYQGCELWDFNLVDPDNRRAVDFNVRRRALADLQRRYRDSPQALAEDLAARWPAGEVKLYVAWRALEVRAARLGAFAEGGYEPLVVSGCHQERLLAFARGGGDRWVAVVAPRHVQCLLRSRQPARSARRVLDVDWQDAAVSLPAPAYAWRNEFTGQLVRPRTSAGEPCAPAAELFDPLPVALLTSQRD